MRQAVNRRRFLQLTVRVGAAALTAACAPAPQAAPTTGPAAPAPAAPAAAPALSPAPPAVSPAPAGSPVAAASPSPVAAASPSPAAPAASSGQAQPAAATVTGPTLSVKLGFIKGIFDAAYLIAAINAGVYKRYNVETELVYFQDDVTATRAIIAGDILTAEISPNRPITAMVEGGGTLKLVGVSYAKLPFVFLARKEIKTWQDLEGKTVGIGAPGDLNHQIALTLFGKHGVDANKVTFANVGPTPQIVLSLLAGKIDAGTGLFSNDIQVANNPDVTRLADVSEELPNVVRFGLAVRQEDLDKRPADLRRFLIAHSDAWRYAVTHRAEVVAASVKDVGLPEPVSTAAFDAPLKRRGVITPSFEITPAQMKDLQDMNVALGNQSKVLTFEQLADTSFIKDIADALGPPNVPYNP
jgi:NitT/TauT family transport system substrate-binding protein